MKIKIVSVLMFAAALVAATFVANCGRNDNDRNKETVIKGNLTVLVDETLMPIAAAQTEIFEMHYNAKITLEPKSENELFRTLAADSSRVAIIARDLTSQERKAFLARKINPKVTKIATDAVALIAPLSYKDSVVDLQAVLAVLQGKKVSGLDGIVFDNPNSSTARLLTQMAGVNSFPKDGVFSFKTNEETIQYVADHSGMIGVVGVNWVVDPAQDLKPYVDKVKILSVRKAAGNQAIFPSQNDIAEGKYPLARDLFFVNCQGYSGLGMGLASFIAGETGQRIILKSGLVPAKTPARKIQIRNGIEKPLK